MPQPLARLRSQMVPLPLWGRNLRVIMGQNTHWRRLRSALLDQQGLICHGCGKEVAKPADLKAHEEWTYLERTDPAVAWLRYVSLVCFHCHAVEHPGVLNSLIARGILTERAREDTVTHYCAVNGVSKRQWSAQLRVANRDHDRRSCRNWYIDYGPLTGWMASTFSTDPLNNCAWDDHIAAKWNGEGDQPTIESVVSCFGEEAIPCSRLGATAHLFEVMAEQKTEERKRKAEKRKAAKLKLSLQRLNPPRRAPSPSARVLNHAGDQRE